MPPHTRRTELTSCFEFAAAGRIPYTGRLGILSDTDRQAVRDALELVGASLWRAGISTASATASASAFCWPVPSASSPGSAAGRADLFSGCQGKDQLLTILQKQAHEQGLAVIVSLHELDMAQKIADAVVCVFPHSVSGALTPRSLRPGEHPGAVQPDQGAVRGRVRPGKACRAKV